MTLIVTINHPKAIVMSADSRRTEEGTTSIGGNPPTLYRNFGSIRKIFPLSGVGCVSYWGEITKLEVELPQHWEILEHNPVNNVIELKDWVFDFLKNTVSPHHHSGGEVGFHVGGYDAEGNPKIFHIFWGWQADVTDHENTPPDYHINDHSKDFIVFNGVPDHARSIFLFLAELQYQVRIKTWIGDYGRVIAVRFSDYLIRYTARHNETVGSFIINNIILPSNKQFLAVNTTNHPMEVVSLSFYLDQLEKSEDWIRGQIYNSVDFGDPLAGGEDYSPVAVVEKRRG